MDKIKFQDSVIELSVADFNILLISLMSERQRYDFLRTFYKSKISYYTHVINQCDELIDKLSECI